jgi:hypothetical protein
MFCYAMHDIREPICLGRVHFELSYRSVLRAGASRELVNQTNRWSDYREAQANQ